MNVIGWISENWIEIAAATVSITYVILTMRQVIWLWLFGILSAGLYAWVYAHSGFYAGMALQGYYALISVYGWYHWSGKGGPSKDGPKVELPVIRLPRKILVILILVWLAIWQFVGFILDRYTDSAIPYWDAFTAAGGMVATWMLARKYLEQWLFWMFIDLVSIGLYIWQGLYATTFLFVIYVIMAVLGYRRWKKSMTAGI